MAGTGRMVGVDVGGTFTDLVELEAGTGQVRLSKVPSTLDNQAFGVLNALRTAGCDLAKLDLIVHGTTTTTNAVLERKLSPTGLITTAGFRDVLELGRRTRPQAYGMTGTFTPIIPRRLRMEVPERMDAAGAVVTELDEDAVRAAGQALIDAGCISVVVHFLHAYANPAHEVRAGEILAEIWPNDHITLGHKILSESREFERGVTAAVNASVQPILARYVDRLRSELSGGGYKGDVLVMNGNGGMVSSARVAEEAAKTVMSGPASGVMAAAYTGRVAGLPDLITYDMGGTSTDVALIRGAEPAVSNEIEIEYAMPIHVPMVDVRTVGAGGGSIARVDAAGLLQVGPESAGAMPGPICYGRGGEEPTISDANLLLGRLDPGNFAGGSIALHPGASEAALTRDIGGALEMAPVEAAFGLSEVVDENMANAARVHAVENGEDLSGYTMIAFGGAAPLHAGRLAEKLGVKRALVPPGAGVGSAIGFLRAPFSFEANRSVYTRLSDMDGSAVRALLDDLGAEATGFVRTCDADAPIETQTKVYMRYTGQGWEIPVPLSPADAATPDPARFKALFEAEYTALFGRPVAGLDIEITVWSVNATTPPPKAAPIAAARPGTPLDAPASRALFDPAQGEAKQAGVFDRSALETGATVSGPAAVTEAETTIILPTSFAAVRQSDGCIDLFAKE